MRRSRVRTPPRALVTVFRSVGERTGGGVGGDDWVGPLLDEDVVPPVDLPWPEYVETPRGREWSMPTPHPNTRLGEPLQGAD